MRTPVKARSRRYQVEVVYRSGGTHIMGRRTRVCFGRVLARLILDPSVEALALPEPMPKTDTVGEYWKKG